MTWWHRIQSAMVLLALAMAMQPGTAVAQTLAHKNWAGSGITVAPWWRTAEFYQIDPISFQDSDGDGFGDLSGIASRLDYLEALGVDALVLSPFQFQAGPRPIDPAYGTEDDFARLVGEATRRHLRVLVDLPVDTAHSQAEAVGAARFWLSRGVAGLRLAEASKPGLAPNDRAAKVQELARICASFAGQRVLLSEHADEALPAIRISHRRGDLASSAATVQVQIDRRLDEATGLNAGGARASLMARDRPDTVTAVATDADDRTRSLVRLAGVADPVAMAKLTAAVLLLGHGTPLVYFGQEIGMASAGPAASGAMPGEPAPMAWDGAKGFSPEGFSKGVPWVDAAPNAATANVALEEADPASLLNWYRKLGTLRHQQVALRSGSLDMVDGLRPDVVAWVRRAVVAGAGTEAVAPVVVVANFSGQAVPLALTMQLGRLGVRPGKAGLHVLAASFAVTGESLPADALTLPAYGVVVAEVRRAAGLETVVLPARRSSRSRSRRSRSGAGIGGIKTDQSGR